MFVISEATAKNVSRLKHCVEVCDTTHQLFGMMWLQHTTFFFDVEGASSFITNHVSNFNLPL
jgi:hypothetical protein